MLPLQYHFRDKCPALMYACHWGKYRCGQTLHLQVHRQVACDGVGRCSVHVRYLNALLWALLLCAVFTKPKCTTLGYDTERSCKQYQCQQRNTSRWLSANTSPFPSNKLHPYNSLSRPCPPPLHFLNSTILSDVKVLPCCRPVLAPASPMWGKKGIRKALKSSDTTASLEAARSHKDTKHMQHLQ